MRMTRRGMLVTGGAVALVGGIGGVGAAAVWPGEASARAPWRRAGESLGDVRLDALAYAILAPNPHNRQPWLFELVGEDVIDVYCDLERRLPHTDPFDRQITIGFGCMLELLAMAAAEKGYAAEVELFPDGAPEPRLRLNGNRMAQVRLREDADVARDPLFAEVLERRSTKEPFDVGRRVDADAVGALMAAVRGGVQARNTLDADRIARLKQLTWDAWMVEYETPRTRRESIDLMRIGNAEVARNPDGIDLGGGVMGAMKLAGVMSRTALDTPGSTAYEQGIAIYREMLDSAQGYVWLTAEENTRVSQIEAGRSWVRVNLAAQAAGLAIHPLSQILQEFDEMAGLRRAVHAELGVDAPGLIHMLARVGYSKPVKASPRWPLETRLIPAEA